MDKRRQDQFKEDYGSSHATKKDWYVELLIKISREVKGTNDRLLCSR
jgi:hypothetical protein